MGRTTALVTVALGLACATAHAEPSNERLVLTGLAMAPVDYMLGVTLHEGSHALAAKLVGAEIDEIHLFPPGIDPKVDKFRFGWVYVRGCRGGNGKISFYLAPKITDALFLSGYAALYLTDSLPSNKYGQLALLVGATGFWVDFAKDVALTSKHNDVVKAFNLWCMTGWRQVPARLAYAVLDLGFAYAVVRGYQKLFDDGDVGMTTTVTMPLMSASF